MIYPKAWDITPISIITKTKTYNGYTTGASETIKVRMQFGYAKLVDKDGVGINCEGIFYKYGELSLNQGDKITFDNNTYEIIRKKEYRMENGNVEYTKVWFK